MTSETPPSPAPEVSPLAEVDPYSLDLEFERIDEKLAAGLPELVTDDMLRAVIQKLRSQRHHFNMDELAGKKAGRRSAPGSAAKVIITVDDLDV